MKKTVMILLLILAGFSIQAQSLSQTIYFDLGKSDLSDKDAAWLDSAAVFLSSAANYSIDIKAYCDAVGTAAANMELAKKRAAAIERVFMISKLNKAKISSDAFGEDEPVAGNDTETGRAKNRRAVVKINYQVKKEKPVAEPEIKTPETLADNPSNALVASNLQIGKTLILKNLNFEGGTDVLLPESEPTLKELLKLMKDNPALEIEIGGHVCCGPDMPLSVLRAKKVFNYLSGYGISEKRMRYKGYSFNKPLTPDRTPAEKSMNRRVEITVLKL